MKASVVVWPGYRLEMRAEGQLVESSIPEPDPAWRDVDHQGHGHFYDEAARDYPTLRWVALPCTMGHGPDCDAEGYWECHVCAERINPGTRLPKPIWITGQREYILTDESEPGKATVFAFPDQIWQEVMEAVRKVIRDKLVPFVIRESRG